MCTVTLEGGEPVHFDLSLSQADGTPFRLDLSDIVRFAPTVKTFSIPISGIGLIPIPIRRRNWQRFICETRCGKYLCASIPLEAFFLVRTLMKKQNGEEGK